MNAPAEYIHFAPGLSSIEEVREAIGGTFWDATTLSKVATCPRKHEVRVEEGLERAGPPSPPMVAGIAVHAGLEYFYSLPREMRETRYAVDQAIGVVMSEWSRFEIDRALMDQKYVHLSPEHLEEVMENYFHCWGHERIETFEPLEVSVDALDLSDVMAARFLLNTEGKVILGESKLVMRFDVEGEPFYLCGKPDLPVTNQTGSVYAMDHKSTGSYLSTWWARNYEVSDQLRGYMGMLDKLLGRTPRGAVINAIYVGKHATNPNSKATKFDRFSFDFSPAHIYESLRNQQARVRMIEHFRKQGYFPQGCGYGGCDMPELCRRDPGTREEVKLTDYQLSTRTFWDL